MTEPTLYLLDTNIISDMMRNPTGGTTVKAAEAARSNSANRMATSVIVECELLFGMRRRTSPRWQQQYEIAMRGIEVLPMAPNVSMTYAILRTQLKAAGTPLGANDTLIAAHALALGATLVSGDAEFSRVPGLMVENWLAVPTALPPTQDVRDPVTGIDNYALNEAEILEKKAC